MALAKLDGCELSASADFHVHLRDSAMMETVVPTIRRGGVNTVYVMPNLVPPVTTVEAATDYRDRLQALEPRVTFLMSLYLHSSVTPDTIREAKKAGVPGVKSYPAGVTTNSDSGVVDYAAFYPVFSAMQDEDMILNLHGEVPDVDVHRAEQSFLPVLVELHERFPRLRIVLEHCTSAAAIETVASLGPSVVATITAHHLSIVVDDWNGEDRGGGDPFCFCKPVAKTPADRDALLRAAASGNPKFFLGTDSAPHPAQAKKGDKPAAGVFTQPYATQLVLDAFEMACETGALKEGDITREALEGFLSKFGRAFYRAPDARNERIVLKRGDERIVDVIRKDGSDVEVVPFRRGRSTWTLTWT
ncbi:hypothetical protein B0A49_08250 [Cryomyces minteri]|uniref:dihydroorotase n=1 Tax=Cryomyces minteri TaxID=331657 RepID=A0A4U0X035_9PEZI|nr:hypothetical protein B0A49_08250 [Cryomyces minteri]